MRQVNSRHHRRHGRAQYGPDLTISARRAAEDVGAVVYATRMPDGLIKIGHSEHIYERLIRLGGIKNVLAIVPGSYEDEQDIHRTLRPHTATGREYYHPTPAVVAVVNEMRERCGMDPIEADQTPTPR